MQTIYTGVNTTYQLAINTAANNGAAFDPSVAPTLTIYQGGTVVLGPTDMTKLAGIVGFYGYSLDLTSITPGNYLAYYAWTDSLGNLYNESEALQIYNPDSEGMGGSVPFIPTIVNQYTTLPQEGILAWLSTDAAGENITVKKTTNSFGNVTFWVPVGNYYLWSDQNTAAYIQQVTVS